MGESIVYAIWSMLFLLACGVIDVKTRKVNVWLCLLNYIMAIIIKIAAREFVPVEILMGLGISVFFLFVSIVTNEAMGIGDALIILTLSAINSVLVTINILILTFVICAVFSTLTIITGKLKLKSSIPFVPFMFLGNVLLSFIPI